MKTRILYPKNLWFNKAFRALSDKSRLLCIFLVSNDNIGLTRIYKQQDLEVEYILKMSNKDILKCKAEIEEVGLFYFKDEWVYINNDFSYTDYTGRDKVMDAKQKEISSIPEDILTHFELVIKGLDSGYQPPINHKPETINHKPKTIRAERSSLSEKNAQFRAQIIQHYNDIFGKGVTSQRSWGDSCDFWLEEYTVEQICQAITNWKTGGWLWKLEGDASIDLIFRRSNKQGSCDYIGQLLNRKKKEIKRI